MPPLLTLPGGRYEAQRLKMIEQALKDKAPSLYRSLKQQNLLQSFVKEREQQLMESYLEGERELTTSARPSKDPLEDYRNLESNLHRLWEESLATWLEFPEEQTTESERESLAESEPVDVESLTPDEKRLKAALMKKALASRLRWLNGSGLILVSSLKKTPSDT
jgi:hypothetical protein